MIGKYFDNGDYYMYYVEELKGDKYVVCNTLKEYIDQPGMFTRNEIVKDEFIQKIVSGEIKEMVTPTFFIITRRDTYSVKSEIQRAGGSWSTTHKFWYFSEKPNLKYTYKECVVFPFTGQAL